eukprot:733454-Rhodomonas_salina.6
MTTQCALLVAFFMLGPCTVQVTEQRVHDVHFPLASSLLRAHLLQADHVVDFFCVAKLNHHKRIRLRGGSDHTASNSFTESSSPPA